MAALIEHLGLPELPKLGLKPKRTDPRTLQFAKYLGVLPDTPPKRSWIDKISNLGMMCNDSVGDCTIATAGHCIQAWTANASSQIIIPDSDVISVYSAITGYNPDDGSNDNGADELSVVQYLYKTGIAGHKLYAYTSAQVARIDLIKAAINIFGSVRLCAGLPIAVQQQIIWKDPQGNLSGDNAVGSWGGHSFPGIAYDSDYLYIITWAKIVQVEWNWWLAYGDEVYAVLSLDWVNKNMAPNQFNLQQLQQDMLNIPSTSGVVINKTPQLSPNGLNFIKNEEGCKLNAYLDSANVPTIGFGSIMYQSGVAVKMGDTITEQQAEDLLAWEVGLKTSAVASYVQTVSLNQNQYDSLISFAYNVGTGALHGSTLLKRILANPQDPTITAAFELWDKIHVDGQLVLSQGLYDRRKREAALYFTAI